MKQIIKESAPKDERKVGAINYGANRTPSNRSPRKSEGEKKQSEEGAKSPLEQQSKEVKREAPIPQQEANSPKLNNASPKEHTLDNVKLEKPIDRKDSGKKVEKELEAASPSPAVRNYPLVSPAHSPAAVPQPSPAPASPRAYTPPAAPPVVSPAAYPYRKVTPAASPVNKYQGLDVKRYFVFRRANGEETLERKSQHKSRYEKVGENEYRFITNQEL